MKDALFSKNISKSNIKFNKDRQICIFGYGSLIAPQGLVGRGLSRRYSKEDFLECSISKYQRGWEATALGHKFLSIKPTDSIKNVVNGCIFKLDEVDFESFMYSEGFGIMNPPYKFVKVCSDISPSLYTCVLDTSGQSIDSDNCQISCGYLSLISDCLAHRGKKFTKDFHKTTLHTGVAKVFFSNRK